MEQGMDRGVEVDVYHEGGESRSKGGGEQRLSADSLQETAGSKGKRLSPTTVMEIWALRVF